MLPIPADTLFRKSVTANTGLSVIARTTIPAITGAVPPPSLGRPHTGNAR